MLFSSKKTGAPDWLAVFLGNPGPRYAGTRHNVGFLTAEKCELDTGAHIRRARFQALTDQCRVGDHTVLLMKPQTYMNLSGDAVIQAVRFYKLPPERVIVVSDDVSLPNGKLRVRAHGSAGGHNGLKSIIARLGSDRFPRVKVGVGAPPHPDYDMADWVLGAPRNQDAAELDAAAARAWEAVKSYITDGAEKTMNRFNG
ncbi:MAG: aminoacyl-tRNA hydrolase [Oscillospiraceae bacterium]|nr:aminoacyl-tRNA hydrolase [Oscillospiraceae bacterium]